MLCQFMRKPRHISSIIFTLFLLSLATEESLMAYADPGSGAMFVQIILAAMIGILFESARLSTASGVRKTDRKLRNFRV